MAHRANQIVDAAVSILEVMADVKVHRGVWRSKGDTINIIVRPGEITPLSKSQVPKYELDLQIIIAGKGAEQDLIASLFDKHEEVHQLLMADTTLGRSFVIDIEIKKISEPEIEISNKPEAAFQATYGVQFQATNQSTFS